MYRWQDPAPPAVAMIRSRRMRQLFIDGAEYVEAEGEGSCTGCAFRDRFFACTRAVELSPGIFGGDCDKRDVIYIRNA